MSARRRLRLLPLACLLLAVALPAGGQEAPPPLTVTAVTVEPSEPAADTLCRLKVTLRNDGTQIASQLGFAVSINSQPLPVYTNQLFMYAVEAGGTLEIPLYNFWSTETSRPMPADARLVVEVRLTEAQWMDISTDAEGVEVWQPLGAVPGLPSSASVTLAMTR